MKKLIFITCLFFVFRCDVFGQDMAKYKGQFFEVMATPGGQDSSRYFIQLPTGERAYLSKLDGWEKPKDRGDGTASYKGEVFPIVTGSRGGRYILKGEKKIYIPKLVKTDSQ